VAEQSEARSTADRLLWLWVRILPGPACCLVYFPATADPSSRGILPTVVCHCVWSRKFKNEADLARVGLLRQRGGVKITPVFLPFRIILNLFSCEIFSSLPPSFSLYDFSYSFVSSKEFETMDTRRNKEVLRCKVLQWVTEKIHEPPVELGPQVTHVTAIRKSLWFIIFLGMLFTLFLLQRVLVHSDEHQFQAYTVPNADVLSRYIWPGFPNLISNPCPTNSFMILIQH
jgi:hypothetical protein